MVKLIDIEVTSAKLALRILAALALATLTVAILYVAPTMGLGYIQAIPNVRMREVLQQLLNPTVAYIGLLAAILVFTTITLRQTKLEGPTLIALGLSLLGYSYSLLHGGIVSTGIPASEIQGLIDLNIPITLKANITINITTLMLASMLPAILLIIKGALLTYYRTR